MRSLLDLLTCEFQGKTLSMLSQRREGGGISGEILTNILKRIDASGVLDRSNGMKPFLLVDAHASQFSPEFLKYITTESYPWAVCIGVPYGTHLWQVAAFKELNGEPNRLVTCNKEGLLQKKSRHDMDPSIV